MKMWTLRFASPIKYKICDQNPNPSSMSVKLTALQLKYC